MDAGGRSVCGALPLQKMGASERSLAPIFCGDHSVLGPLLSMHNGRAESRLAIMLAASVGWVLLDKRGGF